jgi:Asp-tRNA(Asn)/Glu-tRNA(Gln) amidotransferase B subunit
MGKKKDLKKVLVFLADYLKEEKTKKGKKVKVEKTLLVEQKEDELTKLKTPIDNLSVTAEHIKDLMDRIDEKRVEEAKTKTLLSNQRKEFQEEIKKVKENAIEKILESKKEEEEVLLSGVTLSVLNNDFSNLHR